MSGHQVELGDDRGVLVHPIEETVPVQDPVLLRETLIDKGNGASGFCSRILEVDVCCHGPSGIDHSERAAATHEDSNRLLSGNAETCEALSGDTFG